MFDDEPLPAATKALTAPAALSETRLALILRATMLLRGAQGGNRGLQCHFNLRI